METMLHNPEQLIATKVHIGSHWALLGEGAGRMDTMQHNPGQLIATKVHIGLIGSYWVRLQEGWTLGSTTIDNRLPQRSMLGLIGPYLVRLQDRWTPGSSTLDY